MESGGVSANSTRLRPAPTRRVRSAGALETTALPDPVVTAMRKRAFMHGSSKQGKNLRASVASSWVKA